MLVFSILAMTGVEEAVDCKDEEEREDDNVGRLHVVGSFSLGDLLEWHRLFSVSATSISVRRAAPCLRRA
jgi:hypothetical protein